MAFRRTWWRRRFARLMNFLAGLTAVVVPDRALAAILFTDIVGSTERAVALGDHGGGISSRPMTPSPERSSCNTRDGCENHW